jgi:hypothetical protein
MTRPVKRSRRTCAIWPCSFVLFVAVVVVDGEVPIEPGGCDARPVRVAGRAVPEFKGHALVGHGRYRCYGIGCAAGLVGATRHGDEQQRWLGLIVRTAARGSHHG